MNNLPSAGALTTRYATFNHLWATLLLEELYRLGVRDVALAPGSRSAPLTMVASEHPGLCCHTHFDERGLGFMALGLARGSARPVAVITTSGTAVANLYPAVVEARLLGSELIVLSADRPIELLDNGSNQAIDQRDIFARHCVFHHDLPTPDPAIKPTFVLNTVGQAVEAQRRTPGPVHLNCRFREPLYTDGPGIDGSDYLAPLERWRDGRAPWRSWTVAPGMAAYNSDWPHFAHRRGVVVVGRLDDAEQAAQVVALAKRLGWPLLADLQSQVRFDAYNLIHVDLALQDPHFEQALGEAEVLLQFGGRLISKRLTRFIARQPWQDVWYVDPRPQRLDPDEVVRLHWVCEPRDFIEVHACRHSRLPWHELPALMARTSRHLEPFSQAFTELGACHRLAALASGQLWVGNSLVAWLMNMLGSARTAPLQVFANRGASGIDGLIATAFGASLAVAAPTTLVLGDTSALHDLNSLALLKGAEQPLVVVILNNDGGSIFHMLPVPEENGLQERYFRQPHGLDFAHAATMFGLAYAVPESLDDFASAYTQALKAGVTLIELCFSHRQVTEELAALSAVIGGDPDAH